MRGRGSLRACTAASLLLWLGAGCDSFTSPAARLERARAAEARGDYQAATVDLKILLQNHPDDREARLALAEAALALGDPTGAGQSLERAVALGIPAARVEALRFRILLAAGRADEVIEALGSPREGLDEALRVELLARALTARGRAGEAVERLTALPALDREGELALAEGRAALGADTEALATLDRLSMDPSLGARAGLVRGGLLLRAGRSDEAIAALSAAAAHADPKRDLTTFTAVLATLANADVSLGKIEDAKAGLERLQAVAPEALAVRVLAGRIAAKEHRLDAAVTAFTQVTQLAPDNVQVRLLLAAALAEQGNLAQAETQLADAAARSPDDSSVRQMLADLQLRQGRAESASRTLARLEPDASSDATTLLIAARAAAAQGDPEAARHSLDRISLLPSLSPSLRLDVAAVYLGVGEPDKALALIDARPGVGTTEERSKLVHAFALVASNRADDARREVSEYAAAHPADVAAQNVAGLFFAALREPTKARPYLEAALALAPGDVEALDSLAQIELGAGRFEAAESLLRRWLAARPDATPARLTLARVAAARGDAVGARTWLEQARAADPAAIEPRLLLARDYALGGEIEPARAVVGEALQLDATQATSLAMAALVEDRAGDPAKAIEYLRRATDASPRAYDVWVVLGDALLASSDATEARRAFERALALRPGWWPAIEGLALAKEHAGDRTGASATVAKLKATQETRLQGLLLEARLAASRGRYPEAVRALNEALRAAPSEAIVLQRYQAQQRGGLPGAEADLRAWLEQHPGDGGTRMALAELLQAQGNLPASVHEYEAIVARTPNDPVALNNLAWVYFLAKDARALPTARDAAQKAPRVAAIADTLGWLLVSSGQAKEGLDYLKRAATASSADPEVLYHLAEGLAAVGDTTGARKAVESALTSRTAFSSRDRAQALSTRLAGPPAASSP